MVAEVIIDRKARKLNRIFDYIIPEKLKDVVEIGSKVLVPFGNTQMLENGYIINIKETTITVTTRHNVKNNLNRKDFKSIGKGL